MPGPAFLPPAGLSGTQSLLKGQQVTEDARIRTICQMENTAALHPFLSLAAGSCSGRSQMLSLLAQGSGTEGSAQISQVWDGGFESVWEL